jgi:ParB/RepB/Spo0J family partition protein
MAKTKGAVAPVDGASTAADPQASWPFPRSKKAAQENSPEAPDTSTAGEEQDQAAPAADRIRVESLRLYTDPAQNTVERIALEQLLESPFNPRTRYDPQALQELADTIADVGVMQPILVRPMSLPAGYGVTIDGAPARTYEIVFGHRRYRASKLAARADIPAIVRELSDVQSAQLQAIENVQREDLDAIEEALGYQRYIEAHRVSKDDLARELGLSRSHVYARLKLLNAVPAVRDACTAGAIGSEVALLVARIHSPKLQEKALAALKGKYYDLTDGGKKSYRQIRDFLKEKFTLDLKGAIFDTRDAQLLVDAGACTSCPKRSGNALEYLDVVNASTNAWRQRQQGQSNLCTDPECFDAKKRAHLSVEAGKLAAKGKTVVEGAKARQAIGADGVVKGSYVALKDVKALLKKKGTAPAALAIVTIQDPRDGKTVEAVRVDDLKAAGVKVKEPTKGGAGRYDHAADQKRRADEHARRRLKAAEDTRANLALLAAVRRAAAGQPLSTQVLQLVVAAAVRGVDYEARSTLATLHECKTFEQLEKKVGQLPVDRLTTLLLDCALVDNVKADGYRADKPSALLAAAKHFGVDVDAIRKEVASTPIDTSTQDLLPPEEEPDGEEEQAAEA